MKDLFEKRLELEAISSYMRQMPQLEAAKDAPDVERFVGQWKLRNRQKIDAATGAVGAGIGGGVGAGVVDLNDFVGRNAREARAAIAVKQKNKKIEAMLGGKAFSARDGFDQQKTEKKGVEFDVEIGPRKKVKKAKVDNVENGVENA